MKKSNLIGLKFNYLTVIGEGTGKAKNKVYWKCRCDCGNITNIETSKLVSLHTLSCGCIKGKKQIKDLTNKRFGSLTVIKFAYIKENKAYWYCKCDCGREIIKQGKLLNNGHITSCGCRINRKVTKDLTKQKFNRLTVISFAYIKNHKTYWKCQCDCGNIVTVAGTSLTQGNTKSCGCLVHTNTTRIDLQGKKFGKLKVLQYVRTIDKVPIWLCQCDCGNKVAVKSIYLLHNETKSCGCVRNTSFKEKEVVAFVKSIYKGEVIENDRSIIAPKELDVYIPEKNFAIEYNGLYWHSEAQDKGQSYHLNKTKMCMNKGIRLLHIYENEWRDKQDICKSMIASALGIYERKEFARKCEVKEVTDRKTVIDFFEQNHIQGAVYKFSLCLGLYKGDELLQAVVFGKQHFGKNGDYELYRMVTKKNVQVLGGFSKLMKHCPYDTVVSYVALRMFDAKGYLAGNWKIEHISHPSFCITDGINVYSRHLFKKDKCLKLFDNVTEDMTEREMQIKNGYYRLWDCGTYKVRWCRTA